MRCEEYEIPISAYADGELGGPEKTELQSHLKHCAECSRLYEETMQLQRGMTAAMMDCPETPNLVGAVTSTIIPRPSVRFVWAWAAAAAIVLLAIYAYAALRPAQMIVKAPPLPKPVVNERVVKNPRPQLQAPVRTSKPERIASWNARTKKAAHHSPLIPTLHPKLNEQGACPAISQHEEPAEIIVTYEDAGPVAGQSSDIPATCATVPAVGPGRQVVSETEVTVENGQRVRRVCYRIVDNKDNSGNHNKQTQGE
jgi:hypothetical protein